MRSKRAASWTRCFNRTAGARARWRRRRSSLARAVRALPRCPPRRRSWPPVAGAVAARAARTPSTRPAAGLTARSKLPSGSTAWRNSMGSGTMRGPVRALALVLLCTACIERPFAEPATQARSQVDRSALWEVLGVAPPPDAVVVGAVFGNAAELLAYKLEPPQMVAGQRTKLTL